MTERSITLDVTAARLASPDRIMPDPNDPALQRSFKAIPGFGNRVLRVVQWHDNDDIFAVTARWDRGARQ